MKPEFKRVPAIDKCFAILDLISRAKVPLRVSEISEALNYNKSTVFNIAHTLDDLDVLEKSLDGKFQFSLQMYVLGKAAGRRSGLISAVHPYLEKINQETKLSAFLGIRSEVSAIIVDKADSAYDIKINSEIGMKIPLLAGAGGKVLLGQLSEAEVDDILEKNELKKFTPNSCINKKSFKVMIEKVRREGIGIDREEYIEGIRAFAVPLNSSSTGTQIAIWAVGLKRQIPNEAIPKLSDYLKAMAKEIELKLSFG